jgi:Transcription initiation factor TFIID component TAF4 family.
LSLNDRYLIRHCIDVFLAGYSLQADARGQLKFLESLDRIEARRREEQEREMLLRAAKSRSKSEDPEQVKLKAKAKEVSR